MKKIPLAIAALSLSASAQAASIVTNGGFEAPVIGTPYVDYAAPSDAITGWQVTSGSVDLVDSATYPVYEGAQALDLVGSNNGTISQTLTTTRGQVYNLSFFYSNNPNAGAGIFSGLVTVGALSAAFTHNTGVPGNPDWTQFVGSFVGTGSDLLSFRATSGQNNGGIFLDAISVAAVPEPATWGMMILGFGLAGAALRRRRTTISFA